MSDPVPCRERIVVAVLALLQQVSDLPAERNRRVPLGEGELPRQILFEDDEMPSNIFSGQDAFELPLMIQVALSASGDAAATACNRRRAQLQQSLLADRTLGGLASDLEISEPGNWLGVEVESTDFEGFMLAFVVRYATVEGDPFTFS